MSDIHCMTCDALPPAGSRDGGVCPACGGALVSVEVVGEAPPEDEAGPPGISLPPEAAPGDVMLFARPAADAPIPQRRPVRKPPAIPSDGLMIPQAPDVQPLELDPEWVAKRRGLTRSAPPPPATTGAWKLVALLIVLAAGGAVAYVLLHRH